MSSGTIAGPAQPRVGQVKPLGAGLSGGSRPRSRRQRYEQPPFMITGCDVSTLEQRKRSSRTALPAVSAAYIGSVTWARVPNQPCLARCWKWVSGPIAVWPASPGARRACSLDAIAMAIRPAWSGLPMSLSDPARLPRRRERHSPWRRRGRAADHKLGGEFDVMGVELLTRGQPQRGPQRYPAHLAQRLPDRGQRR
jgi:hypothetical protein